MAPCLGDALGVVGVKKRMLFLPISKQSLEILLVLYEASSNRSSFASIGARKFVRIGNRLKVEEGV